MTEDVYKLALERAESDMAHAIQERDKWTLELARLEQLVNSLSAMQKHDVRGALSRYVDEVGFQEVVLTCVRQSTEPITAIGVRDRLTLIGYDFVKFKNPLAVIHGALKRLVSTEKIEDVGNGSYKAAKMGNIAALMGAPVISKRTRTITGVASGPTKRTRDFKK